MNRLAGGKEYFIKVILCLMIFLFLFVESILAFTPPVARDVLIHHLAIPKLWIIHGGFYETPWAEYSYYPMNLSLLYLIPLYFGNDIIPNFIHLGFGVGTGALLYGYLNKRCGKLAGLLGALLFISLPIILRTTTTAYVDVGLVFLVTLSALAFIYWRDAEYKGNGWLLISAAAMGMALGTKYSALPAWFFLTLTVSFIYSRDKGKQWKALQHGLIFFLVSLAVFSPWMIKNALLTGNPLFPLYKSFFSNGGESLQSSASLVSGDVGWGVFKMRQMLYGDSFWETLLIPLRFFLQGQDNTPRYFDGVLNPVLPFLVPFAFMNGKFKTDKRFFLAFAVFFILLAFFTDKHRIRYILPVIPLVIILAVIGFDNIFKSIMQLKQKPALIVCWIAFILALLGVVGFNAVYAKNYFTKIAPIDFMLGKEPRDRFISRHDGSYPAVQYINRHTPADAKIRLIFLAGRGYYLNRNYEDNVSFGSDIIRNLALSSGDGEKFDKYLKSLNCTHFLMRYDLFQQFLKDNYSPEEINRLYGLLSKKVTLIFRDDYYAIFQLNDMS